ncbi:MAG: hypothetical protein MRY64_06390 [Hyphomonadaceae bacterium]|nr:hypothetical protein [Hyphomonadaceae bacterium]
MSVVEFPAGKLGVDEIAHAQSITRNLSYLDRYIDRFAAAVSLIGHIQDEMFSVDPAQLSKSSELPKLMEWQFIAARDAALSVWHFGKCLEACRSKCLPYCPTLTAIADHDQIRSLEKAFKGAFPGHSEVRDSVAHEGQKFSSVAATKKNAMTPEVFMRGVPVVVTGFSEVHPQQSFISDCYQVSYEGRYYKLKLTEESVTSLRRMAEKARQVYTELAVALANS